MAKIMAKRNDLINRLKEYDNQYVTYSDKLSSVCRQLAFAEGGVFWVFKEASNLSIWVAIGLLLLVLYFIADTLQYYCGMRDYEERAEKIRSELNQAKIANTANKRVEKSLQWKLIFIAISSGWLFVLGICKTMGCVNN